MNSVTEYQDEMIAARVEPTEDGRWRLSWTDYVAHENDQEETYAEQCVALLRLAVLAASGSSTCCRLLTHDAEAFADHALTFIENEVE